MLAFSFYAHTHSLTLTLTPFSPPLSLSFACAQDAHPSVVDTPEVRSAMRELHGEYDGNGVLSVALCGSRVASAGREGGVRLWRRPKLVARSSGKRR